MELEWNVELLRNRGKLGLAVSGGADSTALACLCQDAGLDAILLHLNHGLRGRAADADQAFVAEFADQHQVPLHAERVTVHRLRGESLEMAARRERLAFYRRAAEQHRLAAIVTAHHADDAAELFILRLARGSGLSGLTALRRQSQVGDLLILRPLLNLTAGQLRGYLLERGQPWRVDESNLAETIPRNRVRRTIIPYLCAHLGESFRQNLRRTIDLLQTDNDLLEHLAQEAESGQQSPLGQAHVAIQRRVLQYRFPTLPFTERERLRRAGRFATTPPEQPPVWTITCQPTTTVSRTNRMVATIRVEDFKALTCRTWKPGDWIAPIGLSGRKKLQDVFVDLKVPPPVRHTIPLWAFGETSEIAWLPGYRLSARLACRDGESLVQITVNQSPTP